jgi:hypothetical protein
MGRIIFAAALAAAAAAVLAGVASAGGLPPPAASSVTDTRAFVGLNLTFGNGGPTAEGVLGVARVETERGGDSEGTKLSVHMPMAGGISFGSVKLTAMKGKEDLMGEIGLGVGADGVFGTGGLWGPYFNAGADLSLQGGLEGYLGFHTLDGWDLPPPAVAAAAEETGAGDD